MCRPRRFDLTSRETNWAETRSNSLFKPHRKPEKYHKRVFNNRVVQLPVFMQQISSSYYFRETEINWSDSPFCSPRAVWPQSTWGRGRLRMAAKHQTCKGDTKTFKAGGEDTAEAGWSSLHERGFKPPTDQTWSLDEAQQSHVYLWHGTQPSFNTTKLYLTRSQSTSVSGRKGGRKEGWM